MAQSAPFPFGPGTPKESEKSPEGRCPGEPPAPGSSRVPERVRSGVRNDCTCSISMRTLDHRLFSMAPKQKNFELMPMLLRMESGRSQTCNCKYRESLRQWGSAPKGARRTDSVRRNGLLLSQEGCTWRVPKKNLSPMVITVWPEIVWALFCPAFRAKSSGPILVKFC